jgi:hypothetical protein
MIGGKERAFCIGHYIATLVGKLGGARSIGIITTGGLCARRMSGF